MADFRRPLGKLAGGGKTGLQIYQQKGADAYLAYHNGIYATGHNEGKLTTADIQQQAKKAGFDAKKAADVEPVLQSINDLAQEIGLSGTPGVIVMPTTGATEASITVFRGWQTKPRWKPPSKSRRLIPGVLPVQPPTAALLSCVIALFLRRR